MQVQSLGWEDLLEEEMVTHSSIRQNCITVTWKILVYKCVYTLRSSFFFSSHTSFFHKTKENQSHKRNGQDPSSWRPADDLRLGHGTEEPAL